MPELYIGLMSGTSLDGVDAVLADLSAVEPRLIGHYHLAYRSELRDELLALNQPGSDELRRAALAANALARVYAATIVELLEKNSQPTQAVKATGCHGQTVRHQPAERYTIQLVNGALLAELTGIDVVCDFRSRDLAAGGQGAPLAPAFHHAVFARPGLHRVIVNLGGIANLTDLPPSGAVSGFDCGPGNILLDAWAQRHLKQPFDNNGAWARSGRVIPKLLAQLLGDPYFRRAPPKSTGRETFNLDWLMGQLAGGEPPADVQATLLALTARGIADGVGKFCSAAQEIYLCGGGARNTALAELLSQQLAPRSVAASDVLGTNAEHVEALAFAWLARQMLNSQPGNLPRVTGARGSRILGAHYRA
jgi:anhydro-N-acetylmuramic acid kinase